MVKTGSDKCSMVLVSKVFLTRIPDKCWVLGSLPIWRKGPKLEKFMSHLT